jgi:tetratricopeptide (TPR) repeat protein
MCVACYGKVKRRIPSIVFVWPQIAGEMEMLREPFSGFASAGIFHRGVAKYHVSLATSLSTLKHFYRDAVEHFQKAIELAQWNPIAYMQPSEVYEAMELPWRAGTLYSKVLKMDPSHGAARHRLALTDDKAKKKAGLALASLFSELR